MKIRREEETKAADGTTGEEIKDESDKAYLVLIRAMRRENRRDVALDCYWIHLSVCLSACQPVCVFSTLPGSLCLWMCLTSVPVCLSSIYLRVCMRKTECLTAVIWFALIFAFIPVLFHLRIIFCPSLMHRQATVLDSTPKKQLWCNYKKTETEKGKTQTWLLQDPSGLDVWSP